MLTVLAKSARLFEIRLLTAVSETSSSAKARNRPATFVPLIWGWRNRWSVMMKGVLRRFRGYSIRLPSKRGFISFVVKL